MRRSSTAARALPKISKTTNWLVSNIQAPRLTAGGLLNRAILRGNNAGFPREHGYEVYPEEQSRLSLISIGCQTG